MKPLDCLSAPAVALAPYRAVGFLWNEFPLEISCEFCLVAKSSPLLSMTSLDTYYSESFNEDFSSPNPAIFFSTSMELDSSTLPAGRDVVVQSVASSSGPAPLDTVPSTAPTPPGPTGEPRAPDGIFWHVKTRQGQTRWECVKRCDVCGRIVSLGEGTSLHAMKSHQAGIQCS